MLRVLTFPFRVIWSVVVILVPLVGVWVASSLTAYLNGPVWAACVAGALLFPVIPLLWELRAHSKFLTRVDRAKEAGKKAPRRWMTWWDRVVVRTLVVNVAFLAALLMSYPAEGFTALSMRGDWMLQGEQSERADIIRGGLFKASEGLAWLHRMANDNPYEKYDDGTSNTVKPEPNPVPVKPVAGQDDTPSEQKPEDVSPDTPRKFGEVPAWPMKAELHPLVKNIPAEYESSPKMVAEYIASRESDPFLRVKALHDYVANHVAYDIKALRRGDYPPQDAETVFRTGMGVCAGYANLLSEMGRYSGDEIVYVSGHSRGENGEVAGGGHAWNAAKIEGKWYLLDATWDAGHVNGDTFTREYTTNYLFTPPRFFIHDHFPKNSSWQLMEQPITRGEFVRLPMMKARFFAKGYELLSPDRSQVTVNTDEVEVRLRNRLNIPMLVRVAPYGVSASDAQKPCQVSGLGELSITCELSGHGRYVVWMFGKEQGTTYGLVGHVEVNRQ